MRAFLYVAGAAVELVGIILVASPDLIPQAERISEWIGVRYRRAENAMRAMVGLPRRTKNVQLGVLDEINVAESVSLVKSTGAKTLEEKVEFLVQRDQEAQREVNELRDRREALALRWRNVDLATGTLHVLDSKTAAGVRQVDLTAALREELTVWKAETSYPGTDDPVVATSTGKKHNPSNLRRDALRPAVAGANEQLAKDGIAAIGELGFHGLRRTYASLRACVGDDPAYTSNQIGHEDPRFTLRCYTQATRRRERLTGAHVRAYDRAVDWARMGTSAPDEAIPVPVEATKNRA
jgi:Phage integrase family